MSIRGFYILVISSIFLWSCTGTPGDDLKSTETLPHIKPDYTALTIPFNIAPLNFKVVDENEACVVKVVGADDQGFTVQSKNSIIQFPERKWKKLLSENKGKEISFQVFVKQSGKWLKLKSFSNQVSAQEIDPYLYYRLLYPGYESWTEISIVERSLDSFKEKVVIENNVVGQNCVNCHAFNNQNSDDFMFHMRGNLGGTYFADGDDLKKVNLKTPEMQNGATYPRWHPSGKFVAFSSNKVVQQFHSMDNKKIEVSDLNSSLVMYDVAKNEMMQVPVDPDKQFMDTYPEWSPDGRYLYFCRAKQIAEDYDYQDTKYNLCRAEFDPETRSFNAPELVFDAEAIGKSVSFPRISPKGDVLVFTLHDYGCFSIWHKEADLYSIDLADFQVTKCEGNSDFTESYHSWSTNSSWLVFSSKRDDGLTARPYISFVDENGNTSKPFILPQKDPEFYDEFIKTFNIPEFATADVHFKPGKLRSTANKQAVQASWATN
ncbi:TolB family protein [Maribellus sediminis]|uniref:TolB family protein n=1 Tax=Maribellus sediminis TaxID=2696285 RepID=UPI0014309474|nr:PD40 domain-containing protein [Maribellus sediminis]